MAEREALYQLSTINYQLSTINYQLSTINYLSSANLRHGATVDSIIRSHVSCLKINLWFYL